MSSTTRLELRQGQSLVMTPQLQQSIKLLQLNNLEITAYVESELERNPLLEHDETEPPQTEDGDAGPEVDFDADDGAVVDPGEDGSNWAADGGAAGGGDALGPVGQSASRGRSAEFEDRGNVLEQTLSRPKSLKDHLQEQLNVDLVDPGDRLIGVHLIDMLDEAGYLAGDLAGVAERLGCDTARIEAALKKLQRFDPPGVFARSLAECLGLQLEDRGRYDPAMQTLIAHLDLLAKQDLSRLKRLCEVDEDRLAAMVAEIKTLNPKPGLAFDAEVAQPIVPDVILRRHPSSGWQIELNAETLPRVLVNTPYYTRVHGDARNRDEKDYLSECLQSANWLVRALDQRARTILRVARELVRQQEAFFTHGVRFLKPLTLSDIAEAIDMHESTVSRVTTNKYVSTPRGMYELKYFFSTALASANGGEAHSAVAVRDRIKELIDRESADDVLSDDRIAESLTGSGINIARRTVAKYREAMRIPSSAQRRRVKKISA
ncbi:MAG: RNA polymerase factor sigma-54 [Alphaproteobacteria bacterium]